MKKFLCLMLVLLVAVSAVGCGGKESAGDSGVPSLVWYIPGDSQADMDTVMTEVNKKLSEKVGATLDIRFIDAGAFQEKMTMIMASREEFDLCFTGYCNPYVDAVRNGALYCIDDILDTVPGLTKSVPEFALEAAKVDGKLYGVPNYQLCAFSDCIVVNKELAEKYNLDLSTIKQTTDIEPFLKTIKENEPDYYPISVNWGTDAIRSVEEKVYPTEHGCRVVETGKNKYRVESIYDEKYKEKADILHDWFKKGYIRPDSASVMDDTAEIAAGKYAVILANYKPGVEAELKAKNGYDVVVANVSPTVFRMTQPLATMISISSTSKNPEKALKVIEALNTDKELYNMLCFGIEGKHYNKVGENRIELIENSGYNPSASWKFGNQFNAYLLPEQTDDCWEVSEEMNNTAQKIGIPGFVFDSNPVRIQLAQITSVVDKYNIIRSGAQDPDEYYGKFMKELEDAGVKDVIKEYQKQLDDYCKQ